jgi:hypothetical protein
MAEDDKKNRELVPKPTLPDVRAQPIQEIRLGRQETLDVSMLSQREREVLQVEAHRKAIERDDRGQRMQQDIAVTAAQMNLSAKVVSNAAAENTAATVSIAKDDSTGRTEMMFGNTDAARAGKLSRSQQGFGDNTKLWLLLAAIAGVVIVLVAAFHR